MFHFSRRMTQFSNGMGGRSKSCHVWLTTQFLHLSQLHVGLAAWWNYTISKGKMLSSLKHFWYERKSATYFSISKWSGVVKAFNSTRLVVKSETSAFHSSQGKKHSYAVECFLRCFQKSACPANSLGQVPAGVSPWCAGVQRPVLCNLWGCISSPSTIMHIWDAEALFHGG